MTEQDATQFNRVLDALLQQPLAERTAFIDALHGDDAAWKPRLYAMLARASKPEAWALTTLPGLAPSAPQAPRLPGLAPSAQQAPRSQRDELSARRDEAELGKRIGPYRLLRCLGSGGMGVVWLANDMRRVGRQVALKLAHHAHNRADLSARLAREQRALAALDHPNIAQLYEAGTTDEGRPYLVLEYIEGLSLDTYCEQQGPSLARRVPLLIQIADALCHAHARKIVHRDLKPANVLVTPQGQTRLLDFGTAKLLADTRAADFQLSVIAGSPLTPRYASPEQLRGDAEIGLASDIYSFGVLAYEVVTGVSPYPGTAGSSRALREAILERAPQPPSSVTQDRALAEQLRCGLDQLIATALQKRPEQRQGSIDALATALAQEARRFLP